MKKATYGFFICLLSALLILGVTGCGKRDEEKCEHVFSVYVPDGNATCACDGTKTAK